MHWKNENIEVMINNKADQVIEKLFQSLLSRYKIPLETSTKDCEFVFDCVHLLYYKYHKINPNRGGFYVHTPSWIKSEITTINRINKKDNIYFQFAVTNALNSKEIKKDSQRKAKIKLF